MYTHNAYADLGLGREGVRRIVMQFRWMRTVDESCGHSHNVIQNQRIDSVIDGERTWEYSSDTVAPECTPIVNHRYCPLNSCPDPRLFSERATTFRETHRILFCSRDSADDPTTDLDSTNEPDNNSSTGSRRYGLSYREDATPNRCFIS